MSAKIVQMANSYMFALDEQTGEIFKDQALAVGKTFINVEKNQLEFPVGCNLQWKKNIKKDQRCINIVQIDSLEKIVCSMCQLNFVDQPEEGLMLICADCEKSFIEKEGE